jgi:hypothetical protein
MADPKETLQNRNKKIEGEEEEAVENRLDSTLGALGAVTDAVAAPLALAAEAGGIAIDVLTGGTPITEAVDQFQQQSIQYIEEIVGEQVAEALDSLREFVDERIESLSNIANDVSEYFATASIQSDTKVINLAHQCFLAYNVDQFSLFHKNLLANDVRGFAPDFYRGLDGRDFIDTNGYRAKEGGVTRIYLTSDDNTSNFVNKVGIKKHGEKFLNLKTPEIAQLIPRLRIFKVYREKGEATERKVELEFAAGTSADLLRQPQKTEVFPSSTPEFVRGMDVGVESFNWRFIGGDNFTATREIEAELKLSAQTMQAIFFERTSNNVFPKESEKNKFRYLDLVLMPDCRRAETDRSINWTSYSPECYEIQIEVGYNGGATSFGTFDEDAAQFREAIEAQTETLRLTTYEHNFEFKDDGSVGLTIKMKGFLESFAKDKSMNILLPYAGMASGRVKVSLKGLNKDKIIPKYGSDRFKKAYSDYPASDIWPLELVDDLLQALKNVEEKEQDELIKSSIEIIEKQISKLFVATKQALVSHIFNRLETGGAIYTYVLGDQELKDFTSMQTEDGGYPQHTDLSKIENGGIGTYAGGPGSDRFGAFVEEDIGQLTSSLNTYDAITQEDLNALIKGSLDSAFADSRINNLVGKNKLISYFFLGDLIAVILDSITGDDTFEYTLYNSAWDEGLLAGTAVAIGSALGADVGGVQINYEGFRNSTVSQVLKKLRVILGGIPIKIKGDPDTKVVNIAHIPVSVQSFNQFMIDNVLSKDINNYPFFDFIDDLIKSLVIDFLGTRCFGGLIENKLKPQVGVYNSNKEFDIDGSKNGYFAPSPSNQSNYCVLDLTKFNSKNPLFDTNKIQQADLMYFVFGATSLDFGQLQGSYKQDLENGILYLAHGINSGLVKSIKFEKVNQEFVAQARLASEGGTILSQLSNKFDVTIEMVGNNLFRVGQYVYLDASSLGAGPSWYDRGDGADRQRSWSNIMGLGGYHLITAIDNSISSDGTFNTTLKARFETGGRRPRP